MNANKPAPSVRTPLSVTVSSDIHAGGASFRARSLVGRPSR